MPSLKKWIALTGVGCLLVLVAGWFLAIAPQREQAEVLRAAALSQQEANDSLRTSLAVLKAQAKDLPQEQAKLAAVAAKVPVDPAMPSLVRELTAVSDDAGVELVSIAPGAPVPVGAGADPALAPGAVPPSGALSAIPLAVNVVGGYFEVQQFLSGLETMQRAVRVTAVNLTPGASPVAPPTAQTGLEDGRSLSAVITAQAYLSSAGANPAAAAVTPAAVVAGGAPSLPGPASAAPAN